MSSFMMSNESLAKITGWLYKQLNSTQPDLWINDETERIIIESCMEEQKRLNNKIIAFDFEPETLYRTLERMNAESLLQRYGNKLEDNISDVVPGIKIFISFNPIEIYKLIGCYLYQCCEGNIPETKLYKAMETVFNFLAHKIIENLPEYDKFSWG